ncbi:hypothetical protein NDU88_001735 [Pleurodeles waltl]|uniref:Putative nuclease HARBI1 n=1 Tax=Pleurodeles waltl TaxID=8319 RepID=A0AAV7T187_PLEWA|nr:hypothetical protein NDU88_001735 [Pleurodeles waltl]
MEVLFIQYARRRRAQDQQQQLPPHQQGPKRQRRRQIPRTIPPETKLLAVLHMLASGSFQTTGALVAGISQPSFSAFLPKVLDAIISLTPRHISFPNTQQKQQETKQGFYQMNGFPHVLGAIDCTHVRLVPPAATEHLYRNRKHTHSINVQAIVDHRGLITNIVAKYPGSVHDSFIFRHCTIKQHFQDGRYGNVLLVGKYRNLLIYTQHSNPVGHTTHTPQHRHVARKTLRL